MKDASKYFTLLKSSIEPYAKQWRTAEEIKHLLKSDINQIEQNLMPVIQETRNQRQCTCKVCGFSYEEEKIYFDWIHFDVLVVLINECISHKKHEFRNSEIMKMWFNGDSKEHLVELRRFWLLYPIYGQIGNQIWRWIPLKRVSQLMKWETQVREYFIETKEINKTHLSESKIPLSNFTFGMDLKGLNSKLDAYLQKWNLKTKLLYHD